MKKRIISLALALMMCFSLSVTVFAEDVSTTKTITNEMYGYMITETTDTEGRVIRTYSKQNSVVQPRNLANNEPYAETKALLADMGMEEDFINRLSEEKLEMYTNSPTLSSMTSYLKTTPDGMTSIISEDDATSETSDIREMKEAAAIARLTNPSITRNDSSQNFGPENDYMRTFILVALESGYTYNFSVDARWLMMPAVRKRDSLGITTVGHTLEESTFNGWSEYDISTIRDDGSITRTSDGDDNIPYAEDSVLRYGDFVGLGMTFTLPTDKDMGTYVTQYYNYKAHCDFNGEVTYPDERLNFDAVGNYCHSTYRLALSEELKIDSDGIVTFEVAASIEDELENYTVVLEDNINYVP